MKKKYLILMVCLLMILSLLCGCRSANPQEGGESTSKADKTVVRVGALKGPTTMGLLFLMKDNEEGKCSNAYEFQMAVGADEILPQMISGQMDIALVPANVAAILCQKTKGEVAVVDINTLGVLYLVGSNESIVTLEDLREQTIYLTGKGTTPDYVLQYLLKCVGLEEGDYTLEYKSEAAEVAATLVQKENAVGFLPQPFVTAACVQNEGLKVLISANDVWRTMQAEAGNEQGEGYVTGVTVIRKAFLEEHPEAVQVFLKEHEASAAAINANPEEGAELCVQAGIVAKAPIAQKAIPMCNISCITGEKMKNALSEYLTVLYDFNKETVGGELPGEDFYYLGK